MYRERKGDRGCLCIEREFVERDREREIVCRYRESVCLWREIKGSVCRV